MKVKSQNKANSQKHSKEHKLAYTGEDLRWATNELVADWRAERLKCDRIADIGCGIGLQSMSFAKKCRHVIGVDLSAEKISSARKNAQKLNFRNIDFFQGDALHEETIAKLRACQVIFLDPERQESETERNIETIKPHLKQFLEKYTKITDKIAIELPPQIHDIPFECEKEYSSVNGKLNRLTIYLRNLKNSDVSAVVLPQRAVLEKNNKAKLKKTSIPKRYLYEADPAVHKAGLLAELCEKTKTELLNEGKQAYFTSESLTQSDFFKSTHEVLDAIEFSHKEILESLKKHSAGKILIRYSIPPEKYWEERNSYEKMLSGKKQLSLFQFEGLAVITKSILR